jgi:hypothetical protein
VGVMASKIISEGGHYYIDLMGNESAIWDNLLSFLEMQMPYYDLDLIDKTLINEFNAKWLRSNKRNIIKFYSAKDLEFFVLRFS